MTEIRQTERTVHTPTMPTPKRLHFLPAIALDNLGADFFDEAACREWILGKIYSQGIGCPKCGASPIGKRLITVRAGKRIKCSSCGKYYSATTDTFISGTQFSFTEIYLLTLLIALKQPTSIIAHILDTDPGTVRLWKTKFANLELIGKL